MTRMHRRRNSVTAFAALFCVAAVMSAGADLAMGKPKKPAVSNGCTVEQIQAPSSSACLDQLEKDIIDGVAYPHALYCDETGVYCCQGDSTRTFGCKKVASASRLQQLKLMTPVSPGVLQIAPQ